MPLPPDSVGTLFVKSLSAVSPVPVFRSVKLMHARTTLASRTGLSLPNAWSWGCCIAGINTYVHT